MLPDDDLPRTIATVPSCKGRRVLVTGGNRGIGFALVEELVDYGADVIVTCRSSNAELDALNVQVITDCDVTDTSSVAE